MSEEIQAFVDKEEFSYGYIIEVLTGGLYPNKFHVIREYIQNGFDAINDYKKRYDKEESEKLEISLYYSHPSIFIFDNGIGMDKEKIKQYRKIGYSEKLMSESVGFRGIGKLSGLSVAEKLIVTSKQKNADKRHKVVFDAHSMLEEIILLKAEGENVPLNELIQKYTDVSTEFDDDLDKHFTIVELHNIREDSKVLFDEKEMYKYIALNCPVRFDPTFIHASEIEEQLKTFVNDYQTVYIILNGSEVFRPYMEDYKPPGFIPVWDEENEDNPIAFCWYCENKYSGQFEDRDKRGFYFRYKNFTVGDNHLTRKTLWYTTPERSFYFFGEIYICLDEIIPSSERSDFEHNSARVHLYDKCRDVIPKQLNKLAGRSSEVHRAGEKLVTTTEKIAEISKEVEEQKIQKELQFSKAVETLRLVNDLEQRVKFLSGEEKEQANQVIKQGQSIINILKPKVKTQETLFPEEPITKPEEEYIYDIKKELKLEGQAARVYDIIVITLEDFLIDSPETFEKLIKKIRTALEENLYKE